MEAEKAEIEKQKREHQEKLDAERKAKEEEERIAKEEAERIESEKRAEALKPDVEKLRNYINQIKAPFEAPELKEEAAIQLMGTAISSVEELRESLLVRLSNLK